LERAEIAQEIYEGRSELLILAVMNVSEAAKRVKVSQKT